MNDARPVADEIRMLRHEFAKNATEAAAVVEFVARDAAEIAAAISRETRGCTSVVLAEFEVIDGALLSGVRLFDRVIVKPTDEQMANAGAGITEAFAGVASTGSVCIALGAHLTPATSLLMPLHIVLLPAERIVKRPRDVIAECSQRPSGHSFVFTTGPSATADMGPLVRGVHGPHRLYILVLES